MFRDYLRVHPERCAAYAELKLRLAMRFRTDRLAYPNGKGRFVAETLALASPAPNRPPTRRTG